MASELRRAFEDKAAQWDAYTETPAGRLREELNWRYLIAHLPLNPEEARVLDAGAGTGGLGVRLAQRGHRLVLLDVADGMLRRAREKAKRTGVDDRIACHQGRVEDLMGRFEPEAFDAVVCHTLIEYVPDPRAAVRTMAGCLCSGGVFSLAFVNRYADTLRLALGKGDLAGAREALTAETSPADLFGVPRQTFDADAIRAMMTDAGLEIVAHYGVRIFADYVSNADWQNDAEAFESLVALETAAAQRFPYRHIGRYGQIIGRKG